MKAPVTRLDYCQYLLVSQINYTLTNFADHCTQFSHDAINRSLRGEKVTPRLVWEVVARIRKRRSAPGWRGSFPSGLCLRSMLHETHSFEKAP
jgi:hypothetical protein